MHNHDPLMTLNLIGEHLRTVQVMTSRWDESTPCIVIAVDGILDHRTPAFTAKEARSLACALTLAAEEIETGC